MSNGCIPFEWAVENVCLFTVNLKAQSGICDYQEYMAEFNASGLKWVWNML